MKKNILIGLAIFLVSIALTGCSTSGDNFGISPKTINSTDGTFSDDLSVGDDATITGDVTVSGETQLQDTILGGGATTTGAIDGTRITLSASDICNYSVISLLPGNVATDVDVYLPATSTLFADCLDTNGDSKSLFVVNATTAATTTTIYIPTTLIDLVGDDATSDIIGQNESATLTLYRTGTNNMKVYIEDLIAAD